MPKVSVIIPTFNRMDFLVKAIESVLSQTYSDFELIVVDDGSTDDTSEIIKEYVGRLQYFYQDNKGVSAARNWGIKESKGEFITFLDSDDLWKKSKLETQINFMINNPKAKVCYTNEIWIRDGIRVNQGKRHQKYSGWIFEEVLPLCIISPSSVMIKREVFDNVGFFDESLLACEDYDLWIRIAHIYPIHLIDEPLIIKQGGHDDQLSKKFWGIDRFRIQALEKIISNNGLNPNQRHIVIKHLKEKCHIMAKGCFKRNKMEEGNRYLAISMRYEQGQYI